MQPLAIMPIQIQMLSRTFCICLSIGMAACSQQSFPAWVSSPVAPTTAPNFVSRLDVETQALFGGASMIATVTLGRPASENTLVELSMNDPVASVPPAITVPTGATAGSFTVASSVPAEDTRVSLLASVAGRSLQTAFNVWRSVDNEVWYEIIPDGSAAHFTLANAGLIATCQGNILRVTAQRPDWQFSFGATLNGALRPGTYENANEGVTSSSGFLSIRTPSANALQCPSSSTGLNLIGRFTIAAMDLPPRGPVRRFVGAFEQFCRNDFSRSIRGGVRLNNPSPTVANPTSSQSCNQ